jgi:hypothetical protein
MHTMLTAMAELRFLSALLILMQSLVMNVCFCAAAATDDPSCNRVVAKTEYDGAFSLLQSSMQLQAKSDIVDLSSLSIDNVADNEVPANLVNHLELGGDSSDRLREEDFKNLASHTGSIIFAQKVLEVFKGAIESYALTDSNEASVADLILRLYRSKLIQNISTAQAKYFCDVMHQRLDGVENILNVDFASAEDLYKVLTDSPILSLSQWGYSSPVRQGGQTDSGLTLAVARVIAKLSAERQRLGLDQYIEEHSASWDDFPRPHESLKTPVVMFNAVWGARRLNLLDEMIVDKLVLSFEEHYKQQWKSMNVTKYAEYAYGITHIIINDADWYQKELNASYCKMRYGNFLSSLVDLHRNTDLADLYEYPNRTNHLSLFEAIDGDLAAEIGLVLNMCGLGDTEEFYDLHKAADSRAMEMAREQPGESIPSFFCMSE